MGTQTITLRYVGPHPMKHYRGETGRAYGFGKAQRQGEVLASDIPILLAKAGGPLEIVDKKEIEHD